MEPGNRHQVGHSGTVEDRPLIIDDRVLIADRQRDQHAKIRRIGQRAEKAAANRLAQPFDRVAGARDEVVDSFAAAADAAGRADVALKQPGFVVEAVRVGVAVRALEAHRETPALAGANSARVARLVVELASVGAVIPRQLNAARNGRSPRHRFDVEGEALATLEALRQRRNDAGQRDFAHLPVLGQGIGEPLLRQPSGPGETKQRRAEHTPKRARKRSERARHESQPAQHRQADQQFASG